MKYEIELPDVLELGRVRYEPTGEFRNVKDGEVFLNSSGMCERSCHDLGFPRIILRPVWTWPDALKGWGIAADRDGQLWWHETEAILDESEWDSDGEIFDIEPAATMLGFTPPTIHDWTKPILNPRWKGSADAH